MTDLISKIDKLIKDDIGSIQVLVTNFNSVLNETKQEKYIPYLAYIVLENKGRF